MKKTFKLFITILIAVMLIPYTIVNADSTKTEKVLDKLNSSEILKNVNGKATYEDNTIEIKYTVTNSNIRNLSFECENNVIEYTVDEITDYGEAEAASSHYMYALKFISSALKLNGYSEEQITSFFQSEDSELDYEINGIEFKEIGQEKEFTGGPYNATLTVAPMSIKINIPKANLNTSKDDETNLTKTTVEDVVNDLKSDSNFTLYKDENGSTIFEHEIKYEDNYIEIERTDYTYDYHNISFTCEDDVLIYEPEEFTNYDEAIDVTEHEIWAQIIMEYALLTNGYTQEQIKNFIQSEDSKPDYETNGIEVKEAGDAKSFTGDLYGDTITVIPLSIKINFSKANIGTINKEYEILEGANQIFDITKNSKLTFRFSIDYDKFVKEGKIFIDSKEVSKDNYTLSKGSTIVTFNDDYKKTLSLGKHTILASVEDGEVKAEFTIAKTENESTTNKEEVSPNTSNTETVATSTNNPKTGDNIMFYISMFGLSIAGLIGIGIYEMKRKLK